MTYGFLDIISTPANEVIQTQWGSREYFAEFSGDRKFDRFTPDIAEFITQRDTLFMATISENGWPYVQHRGGPRGFVKVLDDRTLAFADYRGNQQYLSSGNIASAGRAALIMIDFVRRRRLKILANAELREIGDDPLLIQQVSDPSYKATIERAVVLHLEAYDLNCPQHIVQRFSADDSIERTRALEERLALLERENAELRSAPTAATHAPQS
jgi:predicted pyridoxine 5'-phosphate oxidase superfamily flavin-nucleotide-binding protein